MLPRVLSRPSTLLWSIGDSNLSPPIDGRQGKGNRFWFTVGHHGGLILLTFGLDPASMKEMARRDQSKGNRQTSLFYLLKEKTRAWRLHPTVIFLKSKEKTNLWFQKNMRSGMSSSSLAGEFQNGRDFYRLVTEEEKKTSKIMKENSWWKYNNFLISISIFIIIFGVFFFISSISVD